MKFTVNVQLNDDNEMGRSKAVRILSILNDIGRDVLNGQISGDLGGDGEVQGSWEIVKGER